MSETKLVLTRMEIDLLRAGYGLCGRVFRFAIGAFANIGGLAHLALDLVDAFLRALRDFVSGRDRAVQMLLRAFHQVLASVVAGPGSKKYAQRRAYTHPYCECRN